MDMGISQNGMLSHVEVSLLLGLHPRAVRYSRFSMQARLWNKDTLTMEFSTKVASDLLLTRSGQALHREWPT